MVSIRDEMQKRRQRFALVRVDTSNSSACLSTQTGKLGSHGGGEERRKEKIKISLSRFSKVRTETPYMTNLGKVLAPTLWLSIEVSH